MPVNRSQGRRRPQVPRSDELAAGVPAPGRDSDPERAAKLAAIARGPDGKLAGSASAAAMGSLGGKAKAKRDRLLRETPRLVRVLGLHGVADTAFAAYLPDAEEFALAECGRLARDVGGGVIGYGPSSMVQSAALQLAGSRFSFDRGDLTTGSRLANESRANLMSARDECAREAEARKASGASEGPRNRWLRPVVASGATQSAPHGSGRPTPPTGTPNGASASPASTEAKS